jgi:cytochrome c2
MGRRRLRRGSLALGVTVRGAGLSEPTGAGGRRASPTQPKRKRGPDIGGRWMSIAGGLALWLVGPLARAQGDDIADGKALYLDNCSSCHGLISSQSSTPRPRRAASVRRPAGISLGHRPAEEGRWVLLGPGSSKTAGTLLAIAPPYGPTLRGVYGRPAGTVADFPYSREFLKRLRSVIWTGETLDIWIKDSQA